MAQLAATLVSTVVGASDSGNLLVDGPGSFGTDGGYVRSVAIGGATFTYNVELNTITASGSGATHSFDGTTHVLSITTAIGGLLALDLDNGAYTYSAPVSVPSDQLETFTYTLSDNDNDLVSSTLSVTILNADRPPIVRNNNVITNAPTVSGDDPIVIPKFALLYNDTDPDGQTIAVTAASTPKTAARQYLIHPTPLALRSAILVPTAGSSPIPAPREPFRTRAPSPSPRATETTRSTATALPIF